MRPVPGTLSCAVARLHARKVRRNTRAFRRGRAVVGPSGKAPLGLPRGRPCRHVRDRPLFASNPGRRRGRGPVFARPSANCRLCYYCSAREHPPTHATVDLTGPCTTFFESRLLSVVSLFQVYTSVPTNAAQVFQLPSDDAAAPKVLREVYLNLIQFSRSVVTVGRERTVLYRLCRMNILEQFKRSTL